MDCVIKTSVNTYTVKTGRGLLGDLKKYLPFSVEGRKILIVTDDNVAPLYLDKVLAQFDNAYSYVIPHGENSKNFSYAEKIASYLAELKFTRKDYVFALGGGVVGDLAGFVSSIYMRGIPFVQLPTSLLAGIDSSVGGKTAVNIPFGKNLVGRVYPPECVLFDIDVLSTLPEAYMRDGIGEGLKYAVLDGEELFSIMENGLDDASIMRFIDLCIDYKKRIVEADENENSLRRLLNLGHTVGHAVERMSNLTITHGVCVSIGLREIVNASRKHGYLQSSVSERIIKLLDDYGVPTNKYPMDKLVEIIAVDKKTDRGIVNLVTVHGIGDCRITPVPLDKLEEFFR